MKLRATAIQYRLSEVTQEPVVDGRLEIQWQDDEPWLRITSLVTWYKEEWLLMVALMQLGARQTNYGRAGVEFIYVDSTLPNDLAASQNE